MPDEDDGCWICGSLEIAYTDVLQLKWCNECFEDIYLGKLDE